MHVVDPARSLLPLADHPRVVAHAYEPRSLERLLDGLLRELSARLPPAGLDPRRLAERTWWTGPEHVLVVDDHDLVTGWGASAGPGGRGHDGHPVRARRAAAGGPRHRTARRAGASGDRSRAGVVRPVPGPAAGVRPDHAGARGRPLRGPGRRRGLREPGAARARVGWSAPGSPRCSCSAACRRDRAGAGLPGHGARTDRVRGLRRGRRRTDRPAGSGPRRRTGRPRPRTVGVGPGRGTLLGRPEARSWSWPSVTAPRWTCGPRATGVSGARS